MENTKRQLGDRPKLSYADDMYKAVEGADVLVLCTEWNPLRALLFRRLNS